MRLPPLLQAARDVLRQIQHEGVMDSFSLMRWRELGMPILPVLAVQFGRNNADGRDLVKAKAEAREIPLHNVLDALRDPLMQAYLASMGCEHCSRCHQAHLSHHCEHCTKAVFLTSSSASALIAQRGFTGDVFIDEICREHDLFASSMSGVINPVIDPEYPKTPFFRDLAETIAQDMSEAWPRLVQRMVKAMPEGCQFKMVERADKLYFFATPDGVTFPWRFDGVSWVANEAAQSDE